MIALGDSLYLQSAWGDAVKAYLRAAGVTTVIIGLTVHRRPRQEP